jgi:hypothetical protein
MKTKTIQKILRSKIDAWAESIEDEGLRRVVKRDTIVTGGCIASMLLKEKVNDYDVYFKKVDTALRVANYYVGQFNKKHHTSTKVVTEEKEGSIAINRIKIVVPSAGVAQDEVITDAETISDVYEETEDAALEVQDNEFRPLFLSTNAITLSDKVQVIIRFWGTPDELHANYDFVHCMNYYEAGTDKLVLRKEALECLLTRELRYVGSRYPLCSIVRLRKFIARNWTINAGQILKMCMQLNDLDLKDPKVLEEQLTGVDMAYFAEILAKVNEKDPKRVDAAYLCTIIDRMF